MTAPLDQLLREMFATDAQRAEPAPDLAVRVRSRVRRRRRWTVSLAAATVLALSATAAAVLPDGSDHGVAAGPGPGPRYALPSLPHPGQLFALLRASLVSADDGCLYAWNGTSKVDLVWPSGTSAERSPDGSVQVFGADGKAWIRTGDTFGAGGGYIQTPGGPCLSGRVWQLSGPPTATARRAVPHLLTAPAGDATESFTGTIGAVRGCLLAISADLPGGQQPVAWPPGYTAGLASDGYIRITAPDGHRIVEGQPVHVRQLGQFAPAAADQPGDCEPPWLVLTTDPGP